MNAREAPRHWRWLVRLREVFGGVFAGLGKAHSPVPSENERDLEAVRGRQDDLERRVKALGIQVVRRRDAG